MKFCAHLVTILFLSATAAVAAAPARPVKWLDNFAAAKSAARKEGKPILLSFTGSDWCPWCAKLEKDVFSQKAFQDYASSNLILFVADFPQRTAQPARLVKQNARLLETYNKEEFFPIILLLDAKGNELGQTGYRPGGAEQFVDNLKELLEQSGWKPETATNRTVKTAAPVAK